MAKKRKKKKNKIFAIKNKQTNAKRQLINKISNTTYSQKHMRYKCKPGQHKK